MKRIIWIIIGLAVIAAMFFQLRNNHEKINITRQDSGISSVVNVNTATVDYKQTDRQLNLTGTLYPSKELNITARAQGQITSLNLERGDYKTQGTTIASIDHELKSLDVANAQLNEVKQKRNLDRTKNLYDGGSATKQQLDDAQDAYDAAKIQLQQAKKQLQDAFITAPLSGVIVDKFVEKGAFINPGGQVATIIDISKLKVRINASESNVYDIKTGDSTLVTSEIYPDQEFLGIVSFVSDRGSESHSYPVEVEIVNSKQYPLKAGTFVNVTIETPGDQKALFIPREALVGSTQDASVYVVDGSKAKLKKITIKNGDSMDLEVLSGLEPGEKVIITGQINLEDGKEINIVNN